jgi:hypothetical protein
MLNGPLQPQALHASVQRRAGDRAENAVKVERREVSQTCQPADQLRFGQANLRWRVRLVSAFVAPLVAEDFLRAVQFFVRSKT